MKPHDLWTLVHRLGDNVRPELRCWAALRTIVDSPGRTVTQVGLGVGVAQPAMMSRIVSWLVKNGYAETQICPDNRRSILLSPTADGATAVRRYEKSILD